MKILRFDSLESVYAALEQGVSVKWKDDHHDVVNHCGGLIAFNSLNGDCIELPNESDPSDFFQVEEKGLAELFAYLAQEGGQ